MTLHRCVSARCVAVAVGFVLGSTSLWSAESADQRYEEALQAVLQDSANPEKSFDFVEAAVAAGDLRGAAASLERILLIDPRLANIRLELGILYLRMGNAPLAQYHINEALKAPNVPQTVRLRAERLLALAGSQARRNTFRFEGSLGYRHDSNANSGPSADAVYVMDPYTQQPILVPVTTGGETEDSALDLTMRVMHQYAFSNGSSWDTQLDGYGVRYNDLEYLDQYSIGLTTGPTLMTGGSPEAPIFIRPYGQVGQAWLDGDDYFSYFGGGLTFSGFWTPATVTQLRVGYQDRDYSNPGGIFLEDRSGDYLNGDLLQIWQLGHWQLSIGATGQSADAVADYQSSKAFGGGAGIRYFRAFGASQLPWNAYLRAAYLKTDYDAPDPFVNVYVTREDEQILVSGGVEVTVTRRLSLALDLSYIDNQSNLPNYEYDNFSAGLRAVLRF